MSEALDALEERLGHRFRDRALIERALTHSSLSGGKDAAESNERLEFLGDRVLALVMAEWLTRLYPAEREGDLGKRFGDLVSRDALARVARELELPAAIRVRDSRQSDPRQSPTVLSDTVEAVLAAIYLDAGLEAARAVVERQWATLIAAQGRPPRSPKTRLQEHLLKRRRGLPDYETVSVGGLGEDALFRAVVRAAGREAMGEGPNKRAAEQAAAEAWLAGLVP
jgi:ribonuclease-3